MTPDARQWRIDRIAEWRARAAALRMASADRHADDVTAWNMSEEIRADTLDRICDRFQAELDGAPIVLDLPPPPPLVPSCAFSGTARDRHLDSARVCRQLGVPAAAEIYERLAAACDDDGSAPPIAAAIVNQPPADAVPFVAGPQIDMFA